LENVDEDPEPERRRTQVRVLPQTEWGRLHDYNTPFKAAGCLPDPRCATVIVEELDGEITGCWMATSIILLEALWRDRPKGFSAKRLLMGMMKHLKDRRAKTAITYIEDPEVADLAKIAGFVQMPGAVHLLTRKE